MKLLFVSQTNFIDQWDMEKNVLDPNKTTAGSNKKAWWRCSKGHSWFANIGSRWQGVGCPYCSNNKVNSENSLLARYPMIAKEWDSEKNKITANQVLPGTIKKYWWRCPEGHSFEAAPNKRTSSNRGCPFCSGRLATNKNSFLVNFPKIAKDFDVEKNHEIDIEKLTINSHKKIWWKCKKGHSWQTAVVNRSKGTGCPFCSTQVSQNELRIFSEISCFFKDALLKEKVYGFECDIYIPSLSLGVEYDGVYWHKNNHKKDLNKNNSLEKENIKLVRIREVGLPKIRDCDIIFDFKDLKAAINSLLAYICSKFSVDSEIAKQIGNYAGRKEFINTDLYADLLERLPSPQYKDSLEFKYPHLVADWNVARNKGLKPADVSAMSSMKVWWKCQKGHEWKAVVSGRSSRGAGCPYCANQWVTKETSLATLRPDVAAEWNYEKNGRLTPDQVFSQSMTKKVWWRCGKGHEWEARIGNRTGRGDKKNTGCPYCANRKVDADNCLTKTNPDLAEQWNYEKNSGLEPSMVTQGSYKRVWWRCQEGHEWQALISSRNKGNGCPYCSNQLVHISKSLIATHPKLANEWSHIKNELLKPDMVVSGSGKKVWWKCVKGHEWQSAISSRALNKAGCPYCSGFYVTPETSLTRHYPAIAREWNYKKNAGLTPEQVTRKSKKIVWWVCSESHEWRAPVGARTMGRYKCPECKNKGEILQQKATKHG